LGHWPAWRIFLDWQVTSPVQTILTDTFDRVTAQPNPPLKKLGARPDHRTVLSAQPSNPETFMPLLRLVFVLTANILGVGLAVQAGESSDKYPLDAPLKVLAEDVKSPSYRKLVVEKMLITDLAAEWQRVETADNPESFMKKHGGKDKVLADPDLKRAYELRVQIRNDFLDLMREGYKRYKQVPPFDKGAKAEAGATTLVKPAVPAVALQCIPASSEALLQWPGFRGPTGQGHARLSDLPVHWNQDGSILWRVKVPGKGNSSPVVWNDRIFLTSSDDKGTERAVHCFSRADGKLLWTAKAPPRPPEPGVRDKNGFASATPVTDGERVISFLGSCGLVCHDFAGKQLWHYDLPNVRTGHGTGSSPILYKDLVILVQDQNQGESLFLALDKKTGAKVWQGKRPKAMTWSTPVLVRVGDRDELLCAGGERVRSYDPNTGQELWTFSGPTIEVIPMLVVGKEVVYCASGRNGPTIALRPGGEGDMTKKSLVWRTARTGPHVPSPILVGELLFTFGDSGVVTCLEAATGALIWQERIEDAFSASPLAAGDRIYIPGESGTVYVLKAAKKLEVLAKNDMGEPILASLAAVDRQLVLRTQTELVLVGKK
jgi:outer membrane protein assembly factor BamB